MPQTVECDTEPLSLDYVTSFQTTSSYYIPYAGAAGQLLYSWQIFLLWNKAL